MKRFAGVVSVGVLLGGMIAAPASAAAAPGAPALAPAVPGAPASAAAERVSAQATGLGQLTDLVAQRIEVGDLVAASKFGTDKPIDDPAREQVVLDQARASAVQLGIDPEETATFFRDQIGASKVVQRGLFARWTAHPAEAPTTRPDLNEIRATLDKLTTELLQALRSTTNVRHAGVRCVVELTTSSITTGFEHRLDRLHTQAFSGAVGHVCS
ncbi:chorismate mutase [Kribbella sp. NPDC051770]|uniref:chorismate mutase n=1 Tax=Kribbella sp. NPDC051770 TaxID=3155413 RepID=UPI003421A149